MTGEEVVSLLCGRIGQRPGLATIALKELNAAQTLKLEKANFYPWFLELDYTNVAFVTVPGQEWVALPADFLGFDEEFGGLWANDSSGSSDPWVPVAKDFYTNFKERYRDPLASASNAANMPCVFDIVGSRIYLRPIPTTAVFLRMNYMQKQNAIANDGTTNAWLTHAHDWLTGEAGIMLAGFQTQNAQLGGLFAGMAVDGANRCRTETTMRRENARTVSMGED